MNKRILLLLVIVALMIPALPVSVSAQNAEDPITKIDAWLASEADQGRFSGSVLVARDEEVLLSEGYGFANQQWRVPNTPDTRFRVATQTQLFTATAIMMLQERGNLTVQDPICDYLDDCPDAWQDITIHHVLTHTSGIPGLWDIPGFEWALPSPPKKTLELLASRPLQFAPGEGHALSAGYIVLGPIVTKASGQSFRSFIQENIFEPLGLNDTGFETATGVTERLADGYLDRSQRAQYVDMSILDSALGLYSTVGDLFKWNQALRSGQVVSSDTWDTMREVAVPVPGMDWSFGYGMLHAFVDGHPADGDNWLGPFIGGYHATVFYLTDENVTISVLSNFESVDTFAYTEKIAQMLLSGE